MTHNFYERKIERLTSLRFFSSSAPTLPFHRILLKNACSYMLFPRTSTNLKCIFFAFIRCRNTVFNAKAQTAGPYLQDLMASGYQRWRVELVDEPADFVAPLVSHYAQTLDAAHASLFEFSTAVVDASTRRNGMEGKSDYAGKTAELLEFLATVPDANGRAHGATEGSLKPSEERKWRTLRPTAAATKAAATLSSFSSSYK
jgi:hypothetical protein